MLAPTIHPLWIRLTHWINAAAVIIMILSGWRIYNASPLFDFEFPPQITIGLGLAGALQWHFAAMWLLCINGVIYLTLNILTGRLAKQFFPLHPREFFQDLIAAVTGKLSHGNLKNYNAVQKAAYLFVIIDITILILSGLVLWKSVQFPWLRELLGGYETARRIHFVAMAGMVGFFLVHIIMTMLVPRTLVAMIRGD
ncbi:MAG: cytochrome b/b6 domain-containing protein [Janthinobacterium lividum]